MKSETALITALINTNVHLNLRGKKKKRKKEAYINFQLLQTSAEGLVLLTGGSRHRGFAVPLPTCLRGSSAQKLIFKKVGS